MRTTLTLEEDVAREIERMRQESRAGLKETIHKVLRAGISALSRKPDRKSGQSFRTEPASLGSPRLPNLDDIDEVLALGEGEGHA